MISSFDIFVQSFFKDFVDTEPLDIVTFVVLLSFIFDIAFNEFIYIDIIMNIKDIDNMFLLINVLMLLMDIYIYMYDSCIIYMRV